MKLLDRATVSSITARAPQAAAPRTSRPQGRADGPERPIASLSPAQVMRVVTGLLWLAIADWWYQQTAFVYGPAVAVVMATAGLGVLAAAVLITEETWERVGDSMLFAGTIVIVATSCVAQLSVVASPTDELALDQAAAARLLGGGNPYTGDFLATLHQFGVVNTTITLHGTVVPSLSYPALSFLLYVPCVALLGSMSDAAAATNVVAWVIAGLVLWRLCTPRTRTWVPVLLAFPTMLSLLLGGDTDPLWIPFALIAVYAWDRFAQPDESSVARWAGPVALGAACAIKQTPWLLAPFLVAGVAMEAHARGAAWRRVSTRYVSLAAATFLIPNLPFAVWDAGAWFSRVTLPVTGDLVPLGFGPVGLVRAYGAGGGNLGLFGIASISTLAAVLALYLSRYQSLKRAIPLLPLMALFVSTRSLSSYFVAAIPALVVCAGSVQPSAAALARVWRRGLAIIAGGLAAVSAALVGAALIWPAPLHLSVTHSITSSTSFAATVDVSNHSGQPLTPHFVLVRGPTPHQLLVVARGPATLAPDSSATYQLTTAGQPDSPQPGERFQIAALTDAPGAMSVSPFSTLPAAPP